MPSGKSRSRAERRARKQLEATGGDAVREVWRVSVIIWSALIAALLPVSLRDVPRALPRFLAHLGRSNEKVRERKADAFLRRMIHERG